MKILSVHNYYQQPGGEDQIFHSTSSLLEENGHDVARYVEHNSRIGTIAPFSVGLKTVWSHSSWSSLGDLISREQPHVAHFHNIFPLISASSYYAARRHDVPIVQELQNFRLLCPGGTLMRDGEICEDCAVRRSLLPSILHRCYRGSRPATSAVVAMLSIHRALGTWNRLVDIYVAPSEFVRRKFIERGFSSERIVVRSNPVVMPAGSLAEPEAVALFVGRLAVEKGISTLENAWQAIPDIPLRLVGAGPLAKDAWPKGITALGALPRERVLELMKSARFLVFPSIWYEGQPMTILEAFACGLPVIASNLGAMAEMIDHGRTGLLFRAGDAEDLARQVRWAWEHPEQLRAMRAAARQEYLDKYTAERGYKALIEVYEMAIENARRRRRDERTALAAVGEAE